jgi:hypothetical protein
MTRIVVTSAVRHAGNEAFSGYLRIVDLEGSAVLHTEPVPESPWRTVDPNPRGGTRGAKGVSVHGDRLVVCNSDAVFVLDDRLGLVSTFTSPLAGAIHDVLAEEDGIWLTCTNADLLARFTWDGELAETWSWRDDAALVRELGFDSLPPLDLSLDYRDPRVLQSGVTNIGHVNGVARGSDGLLVSLGRILSPGEVARRRNMARLGSIAARLGVTRKRKPDTSPTPAGKIPGSSSAIVRRRDDGTAVRLLWKEGIDVPGHNVLERDGAMLYNDTHNGRLVALDRTGEVETASVQIPGVPSFARGLAHWHDDVYLVGSQRPLAVHGVDIQLGALTSTFELDGADNESVYAIALLPDTFVEAPRGRSLFASSTAPEEVS